MSPQTIGAIRLQQGEGVMGSSRILGCGGGQGLGSADGFQDLFETASLVAFTDDFGPAGSGVALGAQGPGLDRFEAAAVKAEGIPAQADGIGTPQAQADHSDQPQNRQADRHGSAGQPWPTRQTRRHG